MRWPEAAATALHHLDRAHGLLHGFEGGRIHDSVFEFLLRVLSLELHGEEAAAQQHGVVVGIYLSLDFACLTVPGGGDRIMRLSLFPEGLQ